jgi:hypothetical protein
MLHILSDSGAVVAAIEGPHNLERIAAIKDRLPHLRTLVRMD